MQSICMPVCLMEAECRRESELETSCMTWRTIEHGGKTNRELREANSSVSFVGVG